MLNSEHKNIWIGLILPNASSSKSLDQFVIPVNEIDAKADIDFFQGLKISMKINRKEAKTQQVGVYS